MKGAHQVLRVS